MNRHSFLIHNEGDHLGIAIEDIRAEEVVVGLTMDTRQPLEVVSRAEIPLGHKIALVELDEGAEVLEYKVPIGLSTSRIEAGDYVHTHNLKSARW